MRVFASLAFLIPLAACGGSSSTPDAAQADAGPPSVKMVTCPASGAPTVTTSDIDITTYTPPSTTIARGGVVKFVMASAHNVTPYNSRTTDSGLRVDFGATTCLQFDKSGSFSFACSSHGFIGTVVVQ